MIQHERVQYLNEDYPRRGRYVLYWMQQSQRSSTNHALELAIREADRLKLPVVAVFGLARRFPGAQSVHYAFMLEGLRETRDALAARGVKLVLRAASPPLAALELAERAALVVTDAGYLRLQRHWRARVARRAGCRVVQVESDVIVPVETASDKEEYAARTIRPRIRRHIERFLVPLEESVPSRDSLRLRISGESLDDTEGLLSRVSVASRACRDDDVRGGTSEARRLLERFLSERLRRYVEDRSDPGCEASSNLSPYLHFGQISPLEILLAARRARGRARAGLPAFTEELVIRRELAANFCRFNDGYDRYETAVPEWARRSLAKHARDKRRRTYTMRQMERAETHDRYWNAAQREMMTRGTMHNYMRMYWGKKIIEWTPSPEEAFRVALSLNNRYEMDGRDPNSFAGVAWCFGKHDRPWAERPVFGQIRWMSLAGLERKFDMEAYVDRVNARSETDLRGQGSRP